MSEPGDLRRLVRQFSEEMRKKMIAKYKDGWGGWEDAEYAEAFRTQIILHAIKGDWADVANFAAFLWYQEQHR